MVSQQLQNCAKIILMLSLRSRFDKNVIYKNDYELVQVWLEYPVHQAHEDGWSVGQIKRLDAKLKVTISSPKCYIRNVGLPHPQLMIARPKSNLREISRTTQLIE